MKIILALILSTLNLCVLGQTDSVKAVAEIITFQKELNEEFKNREESPLNPHDFKRFKGHSFFPVALKYRVSAKLNVTSNTPVFAMRTTTTRLPNYRIYGIAEFVLDGKIFKMPVYQSQDLIKKQEYIDYLFFPFTDLTNNEKTYAGGRFIDLRIPKQGEELIIDFNKAYNPSCAYNHNYSCPLVPTENQMNIEIPAGIIHKKK